MAKPLHVLIIEDSEDDAFLLLHELRKGGYDPIYERIETPEAMRSALERQRWDIIISDYILPKFSGIEALAIYKASGLDMPFIIVSGNIGEDVAVGAMKAGAHDYIIKGNLKRLIPAVERELRETRVRQERSEAEEAFAEQSRILEAFFKHTVTPLVFLDSDLNFIRVNDAYARAFRREASDFQGHNLFEFYPRREDEETFRKVIETKVPYQASAQPFNIPDHPERGVTYWDWSLVPVLDASERVDFLVFSLKDVTDRKEAEDRILMHNKLLQLFSRSFSREAYLDEVVKLISKWSGCGNVGIRILDADDNIPYGALAGFSQEFWETSNCVSSKDGQCACARAMAGASSRSDMQVMSLGGSFYFNNMPEFLAGLSSRERSQFREVCVQNGFLSVAVVPVRYGEKALGVIHIADEKTGMVPLRMIESIELVAPLVGEAIYRFSIEDELRKNLDALRKSEAILLEAQRIAHLGNWDWDLRTNELQWSYGLYQMFGLSKEDFDRQYVTFLNYVHPDDRAMVKKAIDDALLGKKPYDIEHLIVRPGGATRIVHEQGEVGFDGSGKPIRMIATVQDITERKKAEEELSRSRELLRNLSVHLQVATENERTHIAREIHDELGQVMTALKMDVAWLGNKYKDRQALVEKTRSMLKLIDMTIKSVKRIAAELRPGLLDDLGLAAAIEWHVEEFEKRTGISCDVTINPKDISLDRDRSIAIFRVFQEAMTNIAKHAKATEVRISLEKQADRIVLLVEDNGKGVTKKQMQKPNSFGLVGIRERVHFLSGSIDISGVPNKGTSVVISIPVAGEQN